MLNHERWFTLEGQNFIGHDYSEEELTKIGWDGAIEEVWRMLKGDRDGSSVEPVEPVESTAGEKGDGFREACKTCLFKKGCREKTLSYTWEQKSLRELE